MIGVFGAGGFIGHHLVRRLKRDGYRVLGVDLHPPEFGPSDADYFTLGDLTSPALVASLITGYKLTEIYQLATDMGGADYIFTGGADAHVMYTGAQINLNVLEEGRKHGVQRFFFSSSACVYPYTLQESPDASALTEDQVLPANPDSEYGWEKLFAERLYLAYARNYNLSVHIARFCSIVGPEGTWRGGKEKVFAALCRKIAEAEGSIQIYGDGEQTRTFLYVDDCVDAVVRLMASGHAGPFNIGSEELISINTLAWLIMEVAGKQLAILHTDGPLGVRGRVPSTAAIERAIGWRPRWSLQQAVEQTYPWVAQQVEKARVQA